ncbi:MAG: DUF4317 domain-containing protein [Bacillota bacterium]|jgi:hypothetical protein
MNQKELNEIRRHLTVDKNNIRRVYGCYVNQLGEIIASPEESLAMASENEAEQYLALLKKTLSGGIGRHLVDIVFANEQVQNGGEHRLLTRLYESRLEDGEARQELFRKIIETKPVADSNYLILLAHDVYDVPHEAADALRDRENDENVFSYFLCAICPVKEGRASLGYAPADRVFRRVSAGYLVGNPLFGFMFPAFDDRAANIYNALFYEKDASSAPRELIDALFKIEEIPLSAGEQRVAFRSVLEAALGEECRLDVVQDLHDHVRDRLMVHKETRNPEEPEIPVEEVCGVLRESGVSVPRVEAFQKECSAAFGDGAALKPENILNSKKFEITTAKVKISVDPENSYIVETRVIDGRKYILIPASGDTALNGVEVTIESEGPAE